MHHIRKSKWKTITTVGFALFAMFFGAGNLILPPFIGLRTEGEWGMALLGFFITAILAPFLGVLMVAKTGTHFTDLGKKTHPWLIKILTLLVILCIGPLVAIPRTAATTFEVGIQPLLPAFPKVWFIVLFFAVVTVLSISKSKIVSIIGRFLTPFLLIVLVVLIVLGVCFPPDSITSTAFTATESFSLGFLEGYQTMDLLASVIFAGIVIAAVIDSGYTSRNERVSVTFAAGMLSTLCLLFIYGGLIYLGATTDYPLTDSVQRTELLLHISHSVLGKWGTITVALAIGFACLTTAIALTSAVGLFFEEVTHQRIPYKVGAIACTLISLVLSINTVDNIINYAIYILLFIYPIVSTLIITVLFFDRFVNSKLPYILSVLITAIISTIDSCQTLELPFDKLYEIKSLLPLSDYGLEWFLPALLTFIITAFIKGFKKK